MVVAGGIGVAVAMLFLLWYMLRLRNRRNKALADSATALTERNTALSERATALAERTEALTERNKALDEMNNTKDKFFNIISHDMRNPAVAQRDALKLLAQHGSRWDAATLANYYDSLLESAEGHVELIYNLLGWAQLQTGRLTYNPDTFDFVAALRTDITLIRNMAKKKNVTFAVEMPEEADVYGDRAMLTTVVRNLLANAVKFTPAGGTVTLHLTPDPSPKGRGGIVSPPSFGGGLGGEVSVSDTGIGMTEEQIHNLFRLGSVHSSQGTAGEQGTGLGLIVCREMLQQHGIDLHVESAPNKGTRFWFTLKASPPTPLP